MRTTGRDVWSGRPPTIGLASPRGESADLAVPGRLWERLDDAADTGRGEGGGRGTAMGGRRCICSFRSM